MILNRLGYTNDQSGIISRYMREKSAWHSHITNTKQWIINFCEQNSFTSIAVLGSGWFLDVPVEYLLQKFHHIYVIDILHPPQILQKYKNHRNISFIQADVTGGLIYKVYELLYTDTNNESLDSVMSHIPQFSMPYNVDCVVSLNILNQLDILLCDAIQSKVDYKLDGFRKLVQQAHISFLQQYNFCLISDWVQYTTDFRTQLTRQLNLVYVPEPVCTHAQEWVWDFDSQGYYVDNSSVSFLVKAFSNTLNDK
ncbi:MAG: hypothetical protein R6U95_03510 [Bacteroidales bacterium]